MNKNESARLSFEEVSVKLWRQLAILVVLYRIVFRGIAAPVLSPCTGSCSQRPPPPRSPCKSDRVLTRGTDRGRSGCRRVFQEPAHSSLAVPSLPHND
ncbi:hypothetical protein BHE74_00005460 [Ensete ventricosum]|nr:hypothetical protein BHE74_00005460 [Ensete ventricosum]